MANVQPQMLQFHEKIKLKRFEENALLREKRDRILDRFDRGLKTIFESQNLNPPEYETSAQGSYPMGAGTIPLNGDYDIDVGIRFKISKNDYPNPLEPKQWVYDALEGHTKRVEIRRSCVTVFYQQEGELLYHVDLAIYSDKDSNSDGKMYLAKGKSNSSQEYKIWEESDPQGLIELIRNYFQDREDDKQFRRTIRYLKRWKDVKFPNQGNAAPIGIGITVAAYRWFKPVKTVNSFDNAPKYDDLEALQLFVSAMLNRFQSVDWDGDLVKRLKVELPVVPHNDVFEKMSNLQMAKFEENLKVLLNAIQEAQQAADPVEACQLLQKQFGDDFYIPSKEETAQKRSRSIISSSASA